MILPRLLKKLIVVLAVLIFIDALVPQLVFLTGLSLPYAGTAMFKAVVVLMAGFLILNARSIDLNDVSVFYFGLAFYILVHSVIIVLLGSADLTDVLISLIGYYYFIIVAPFAYLKKSNNISYPIKLSILLFTALTTLGFGQFILNKPLIQTYDAGSNFQVNSWNFYTSVRAFSLFTSPANFGHFIAIFGSIIMSYFMLKKQWIRTLIILAIILTATYTTLTRATYIEVFLTLITLILLHLSIKHLNHILVRILLYILPIVYTVMTILVVARSYLIGSRLQGLTGILSDDTLNLRLLAWTQYWIQYSTSTPIDLLFGTGYVQNDQSRSGALLPIDNLYLALLLNIGAIGTFVVVFAIFYTWKILIKKIRNGNMLAIPIAAYWATFLATAIFGVNISNYFLVIFVLGFFREYRIKGKNNDRQVHF